MPGADEFRLDDEQRKQVHECVRKGTVRLGEPFEVFVSRIENSIHRFRATAPQSTFREAHDALRAIWFLAHEDDPSPARLRTRLNDLPARALWEIDLRAEILVPRLFPGESPKNGFLNWTKTADREKLVTALQALIADGGQIVEGKSRGKGKRSGRRLEPRILGHVRGLPESRHRGGRPVNDTRQTLVMFLACDWVYGTGVSPSTGRSDASGFGDLVHSIFQWLEISKDPTEAAAYELRRYWREVRQGFDFPAPEAGPRES